MSSRGRIEQPAKLDELNQLVAQMKEDAEQHNIERVKLEAIESPWSKIRVSLKNFTGAGEGTGEGSCRGRGRDGCKESSP